MGDILDSAIVRVDVVEGVGVSLICAEIVLRSACTVVTFKLDATRDPGFVLSNFALGNIRLKVLLIFFMSEGIYCGVFIESLLLSPLKALKSPIYLYPEGSVKRSDISVHFIDIQLEGGTDIFRLKYHT